MHQYFCLLRQSKFGFGFWFCSGLVFFKIYLEIAVASASAHRVGEKSSLDSIRNLRLN